MKSQLFLMARRIYATLKRSILGYSVFLPMPMVLLLAPRLRPFNDYIFKFPLQLDKIYSLFDVSEQWTHLL